MIKKEFRVPDVPKRVTPSSSITLPKRNQLLEKNIEVIQSLGYVQNKNIRLIKSKNYLVLYRGTRNGNELKSMM